MNFQLSDTTKNAVDWGVFVTAMATFFQYLPDITALFSLLWLILRIYETDTVQKIIKKFTKET